MLHSNAILKGDTESLLKFTNEEHPLAIQLGGSDPKSLAEASVIAEEFGYKEINLNVGCPSSKVQKGKFGAVLMKEPRLVSECINEMHKSVNIPVTVKCRIGVDDMDKESALDRFVEEVSSSGCSTFIIHARKAWLKGLSPKENREIPPLDYERVYRLKEKFHSLNIVVNGGIKSVKDSLNHLQFVDGVMLGREAYDNPYILTEVDSLIFNKVAYPKTRQDILLEMLPYIEHELQKGTKITRITKHLLGLFKGLDGAKKIREFLVTLNNEMNPLDYKYFFSGTAK
jgi:tRNA-dihydrouridine synthase A